MSAPPHDVLLFRADYRHDAPDLHAVRDAVFVAEQHVPLALERDALDPVSLHVLARDARGYPVGTARLTPDGRIGRMAVLAGHRDQGVGEAMLLELIEAARERGLAELQLHAQCAAEGFYHRFGFLPEGEVFEEAGIAHRHMRRRLDGQPQPVVTRDAAIAVLVALAGMARRALWLRTRELDPGLFDAAEVVDALRRFATHRREAEVRILLHDAAAAQRARSPLLALAQRLPSVFALREVSDPVDRNYPAAFAINDRGGWYYRALGHRLEGDASLDAPGRGRQLQADFEPVWERARVASELRALEL
jgi:predicted GNAT family N-acyltransferase